MEFATFQPVARRNSRRVITGIVGRPTITAVIVAAIASRGSCFSTNVESTAASTEPTDISVSVSRSTLATPSRIEITRGLISPMRITSTSALPGTYFPRCPTK